MENKWISVKDRLPETGDEYNVVWDWNDGTGPTVTTMEYDAKEAKFLDVMGFTNSDETENITHWQPLPELP